MKRQRLIEVRKSSGYTQKNVADYIGKARNTYTQYETGKSELPFKTIVKIKELLNYSNDDIYL